MLPITVPGRFRIIAHRGASAYAPENTLAAFDLALKMGVREVELDTRLSLDGEVVLCHDAMLERYGHGPRAVEETTAAELLSLDMGSWFSPFLFAGERMTTLEALFERHRDGLVYHVELKGESLGLPEAVAHAISAHRMDGHCVVVSFTWESLVRMRQVAPSLRLGWIINDISDVTLARARELDLFQLCPFADAVSSTLVREAHAVVEEVRAWGLAGEHKRILALITKVIDAGCDGVTISSPDWLVHEGNG